MNERGVSRVAVIGGGISGLAAALRVRDLMPSARITVIEGAGRLGGKLYTDEFAYGRIELGAEAFLVRRPEAKRLADRLGLALDAPATTQASVFTDEALRPLPSRTMLGIPADLTALAQSGVLGPADVAHVNDEPDRPGPLLREDIAVGVLARQRFGNALVDRLMDPLLGGVYAGFADEISVRAALPQLAAKLEHTPSMVVGARSLMGSGVTSGPVFNTVHNGLSALVELVAATSGADIRLGLPARELQRRPDGWRVIVGMSRERQMVEADSVIIACPARPASRLLRSVAPHAAESLAQIEYAGVALVTFALPPGTSLPPGSGVLVPAAAGLDVKAVTFSSQKWGREGTPIIRASLGRFGQERVLARDDDGLAELVIRDLLAMGIKVPTPIATHVQRWGGALPQYFVGHLDRLEQARRALPEGLAIAGAGYDGVGIPACIASGQRAADQILTRRVIR
ncbi:MAG: protoporphyrinogen oxidase [Corynebacteriales bacterium]|nr:protoporphyrinogen oxidase [Mycobacteriales bacterium]